MLELITETKNNEKRVPFALRSKSERLAGKDVYDFIGQYVGWMKGSLVRAESLHVYNFGYRSTLPLPVLDLTPDSKLEVNLETSGMNTPSRWSLVVVGEKYISRFDEVMEVVDRIHEKTHALPFAVFVETEEEIQITNVTSHMTSALVGRL